MGILMIGMVSVAVLVWGLAFCLATECASEKRRASRAGTEPRALFPAVRLEPPQAA